MNLTTKKVLEETALELNITFKEVYAIYMFQNKNIMKEMRTKNYNDIIIKYLFKFIKPYKVKK